jgi:hypothetical protein
MIPNGITGLERVKGLSVGRTYIGRGGGGVEFTITPLFTYSKLR